MEWLEVKIDELPHRRDDTFFSLYANSTGVGTNFYDVGIIFGEINLRATKEESHIKDKVAVVMSWEHAKALIASLQGIVEEYERTTGPIRTLPEPESAEQEHEIA